MFCHVQFCTLSVHINICFCMGFLSCISLYKWRSIFLWVFVMYMFVQMTIHFLVYGFLSMHISVRMTIHFFWMGFHHAHLCTNDYPFLLMGFRYEHFCTNDYPFLFEWIIVMHISVQRSNIYFWMDCCHALFCTKECHFFLNGLLSCTFLYDWLPFIFQWIVVMLISVRITTISFWIDFCHAHFCTND